MQERSDASPYQRHQLLLLLMIKTRLPAFWALFWEQLFECAQLLEAFE